ncbi:uncharacterized protein MAM_05936 [Metarhizium album ARSEF 1941]|uniref:Uncharacterized protein n=1 Tax=Metarhizium album (strain ARSEF 1941) TaxID=1081103 RepID=A0A0B2WPZ4_METAS|nr:uncharacterized protein MAM_05936 [Metarhizium album ARSEF 1941]KHN96088.1 hypothetical protein MAM_05936 [Metarhizium album ARSEF 1941]
MPLNPAFGLGPNPAFSGSMDVFSVQQSRAADMDGAEQQQGSASSLAPPEMSFNLSSSSASTEALDTPLDFVGQQGFYPGSEYYQHWPHPDGGSSGHHPPWDATTVWSEGSSSIPEAMMFEDVPMDPAWAQSMLDPSLSMDTYGEHSMAYYGQGMHGVDYGRPGKRHAKSSSVSY